MPSYEILCIIKQLQRPELVNTIKRSAEAIITRGGIIRAFENLGYKQLPYKMKTKDGTHDMGNHILIKFDCTRQSIEAIKSEITKDVDHIRTNLAKMDQLDDKQGEENICYCKQEGKFIKDQIDYMKPLNVWNKRSIYKDYGVRL